MKIVSVLVLAIALEACATAQPPRENDASAGGNNQFALQMYGALSGQEGNLFFSPYSISSALAMVYGGARANTADEMKKTLHFTDGEKVHAQFARLNARLDKAQEGGKIKLVVANSLWPQAGHKFLPDYLALVKKDYGSSVTPLDYQSDAKGAVEKINKWVEDKTQNKIRKLFSQLSADTRLVLVNAIYFKGAWAEPFDAKETQEEEFTLAGGGKIKTPMMHLTKKFGFAQADGVKLLEMPYAGNQMSLVALLPDDAAGLAKLEKELTTKNLGAWLDQLSTEKVIVALPKFKITWGATELNAPLKKLGMGDAFNPGAADFSGMDGVKDLFLSRVVHKAFIEVNEEGTEAAAATGAVMMLTAMPPTNEPPTFIADHPFLFLIREKTTGCILFIGRVMDPPREKED